MGNVASGGDDLVTPSSAGSAALGPVAVLQRKYARQRVELIGRRELAIAQREGGVGHWTRQNSSPSRPKTRFWPAYISRDCRQGIIIDSQRHLPVTMLATEALWRLAPLCAA